MIFEAHTQGSPEWLQARAGVITASEFKTATEKMLRTAGERKTGDPTGMADKYCATVAMEIISGLPYGDNYVTWAMKKGQEREPAARMAYELRTNLMAEEAGIVFTDDRRFGYSTDGFVGQDGMIEIKCLSAAEKIVAIRGKGDVSDYLHQMQGGLWITGRQWCDFVLFVPELEKAGTELYIKRIHRDEEFIATLEADLLAAMRRVDACVRALSAPAGDFTPTSLEAVMATVAPPAIAALFQPRAEAIPA